MSTAPWENEEKRNFACMDNIVTEIVGEGLRTIFKQEWNSRYQAKFGVWNDTSVSGQQLYNLEKTRKKKPNTTYLSKFQNGDTSQWDCTVLFDAILYSNSIGKASLNPATENEVENLRKIRNKIKHATEGKLSDTDFQRMTTGVENAFKALGLSPSRIARIKAERNRYRSFEVLPPKPAHDVIPRTEKMREISGDLEKLRSAGKLTYFYISGNPGSGKSQLTRQVCEKIWQSANWSEVPMFMMTLNGRDVDSLLNSYEEFARRMNCDESVLLNVLSSTKKTEEKIEDLRSLITTRMKNWNKWWLVVDNVENLEIISPLLPQTGDDVWNHGQIIVTTQNQSHIPSDSLLTKHVSISSGMSDLESRQLLSSLSESDSNDPLLDEVVEQLDRQPLAMAAAAVYFKQTFETSSKSSWHDYLQKLEDGKRRITEEQLCNINPAYSSTMTAAVLLAVKECAEHDSNLKHVFQFLAFVSFESMPLDLFANYIRLVDENFDREEVFLAIHQCSLFLPTKNVDRDIRIHRVVHEVIKFFCESDKAAETAHASEERGAELEPNDVKCHFQNVVRTLYHFKGRHDKAKLVPHLKSFNQAVKKLYLVYDQLYQEDSFTDTHEIFQMYMFFADILHEFYKHKLSLDFLNRCLQLSQCLENELCVADVYNMFGTAHKEMCELEKAKDYHQRALKLRKQQLGEKHIDVAASYNNLGLVHHTAGEYEKSKDYLQRAVDIKKEKLGEKHVQVANSYNNLGSVFETTCEYEKAKEYYQRALEIQMEKLGEKHVDVAASYSNLGEVYRRTCKMEKAKDYHQRALEIRRQQLGETHVDVGSSYNNLGIVHKITSEYEKAKDYDQRAIDILTQQLGEKHVDVAASYTNLGELYREIGELAKAKEYFERALEIFTQRLGKKHVDVACCYNFLGNVYQITGEYEKAKDYHRRALEICKEQLDEENVYVASCYNYLGNVHETVGEYEQAKDYLCLALEIHIRKLGEKHVDVASSYINLGGVYLHIGELAKAKEYFERALDILKGHFSERHVAVASCYDNLGIVCHMTGEFEKAKDYSLRALEIRKEQLGENHADVASSYNNLGNMYQIAGEYEKAKDYYQRALEICKEQLGEQHIDVAASYNNLGVVLEATCEYEKAKDYHERALEIRKGQLGEKHVDVAVSYNNLGEVYRRTGELEKAKDCHQRALEIRKQTAR